MPLQQLLKTLGLTGAAAPAPASGGALLDHLRRHVSSIDEDRLEYLAAFAAQLARVAWADDEVSPEERVAMRTILERHAGLAANEAGVVADLLCEDRQILRDVEPGRLTRALNALASRDEKESLIDCVYAIAAADHMVSNGEDQEARRIGHALMLSHSRLMDIRGRYRDRLEVLRLARPERSQRADED